MYFGVFRYLRFFKDLRQQNLGCPRLLMFLRRKRKTRSISSIRESLSIFPSDRLFRTLRDLVSWKSRHPTLRALLLYTFYHVPLFYGFSSFSRGRQRNVRFSRLLLASLSLFLFCPAPFSPVFLSLSLSVCYSPPPAARRSPSRCVKVRLWHASSGEQIDSS